MNWVILGVISTKVAMELAMILAGLLALLFAGLALWAVTRANDRMAMFIRRRILLIPVQTVVPARASARRLLNGPSRASPGMIFDQRYTVDDFGRTHGCSRRR